MTLLTGFPGFLGYEWIRKHLSSSNPSPVVCLIQNKFRPLAETKLDLLKAEFGTGKAGLVTLTEGDITLSQMGLSETFDPSAITEVFHFAAVYDLNVSKNLGHLVNVEGTRNVLKFCQSIPNLTRLHYVSTCYVSGRYNGRFTEKDLDQAGPFNNYYESTKHEAERLVREAMSCGLPATIYRPSIVVGNSATGETEKFDGPYFVLQWIMRQGRVAFLPELGDPNAYRINLVPSDYVVNALYALSRMPETTGKCFQLADPKPLTIKEVVDEFAKLTNKKLITLRLPKNLAKWCVANLPGLEKFMGIPRSALDYFVHPTEYDVSETLDALKSTGIKCPPFRDYAKNLVQYRIAHPEKRSKALT